jgi:hypothetical protein
MWDKTIGLRRLKQAQNFLLREFNIDVRERDGVKARVPEPLKGVRHVRWTDKTELAIFPLGLTGVPVVVQDLNCRWDQIGISCSPIVFHFSTPSISLVPFYVHCNADVKDSRRNFRPG